MNRLLLNFFKSPKRLLKFTKIALYKADIHGFYHRKFGRGFEQSKHRGLV